MLSFETEEKLADLLTKLIDGEHIVEVQRKTLAEDYNFNPSLAFQHLDCYDLDTLTASSLKTYFDSSQYTEKDYYLLIKQYSSQNNGRLTFNDFTRLLLPRTDVCLLNPTVPPNKFRALQKWAMKRVIEREMELQCQLEGLKQVLNGFDDWTVAKGFKAIDTQAKGHIEQADLVSFAKKHARPWFRNDFSALFRRICTGSEEIIGFEEFAECVLPLYSRVNVSFSTKKEVAERENKLEKVETELSPVKLTLHAPRHHPSSPDLQIFAKLISQQLKTHNLLEGYQKNLTAQASFSVPTVFSHFCWSSTVSLTEFERSLTELGLKFEQQESSSVYRRVTNEDGLLDEQTLTQLISPASTPVVPRPAQDKLNFQSLLCLFELFNFLLKAENKLNSIKRQIKSVSDLFRSIDTDQDGLISREDFVNAVQTSGLAFDRISSLYRTYLEPSTGELDFKQFKTMVSTGYIKDTL